MMRYVEDEDDEANEEEVLKRVIPDARSSC